MRSAAPEPRPALLALYWLGIQTVWGALLGISLQARSAELVAGDALAAYAILATSGAVVAAVVQLAAGWASDRRRRTAADRTRFYVAGGVVGAAGIAWFYLAPSFAQVVGAYAVVEVGLNVAMAAYQPVIPDFVRADRVGLASSWMGALQSLGNAVGAVIAAKVADARMAALAIVAVLLAGCAATAAHASRLPLNRAARGSRQTPRGAFGWLFVSRAFVYLGFFTLLGYLFFYVRAIVPGASLEAAKGTSGLMVLTFTIAGAAGAALAARPTDRADKRAVVGIGCGGVVVALIVLAATSDLRIAFAATAFAGASWGAFLAADWALACRVLPADALAFLMAVWNLAIVLPQIVAPALTDALLARGGALAGSNAPRLAFALACIEIIIGLSCILRLPSGIARNKPPGITR